MTTTVAKVLLLGVPLVLSLGWFTFWVLRLLRMAKKLKRARSSTTAESSRDKSPRGGS